jgi:hypothetical protein
VIPLHISLVASIVSFAFLVGILELIRRRRLQERYALLWLLTSLVIFILSAWRDALRLVADAVGVAYPPSALFVIASFFILVVLLHYSTVISELSERNVTLAQRLAILEERLRRAETRGEGGSGLPS